MAALLEGAAGGQTQQVGRIARDGGQLFPFGVEAGKPLASSNRVAKVAFTGETTTGRLIMQYASENLIPVTLELGGKSPNIFLADVMAADDDFLDKAIEGFVMFALNQGEVCTCPSRALVAESIYDDGRAFTGVAEVTIPVGVVALTTGIILVATKKSSKSKN